MQFLIANSLTLILQSCNCYGNAVLRPKMLVLIEVDGPQNEKMFILFSTSTISFTNNST